MIIKLCNNSKRTKVLFCLATAVVLWLTAFRRSCSVVFPVHQWRVNISLCPTLLTVHLRLGKFNYCVASLQKGWVSRKSVSAFVVNPEFELVTRGKNNVSWVCSALLCLVTHLSSLRLSKSLYLSSTIRIFCHKQLGSSLEL